jgi:hypothetical protein
MWILVSDFTAQSINCSMPFWTSDLPRFQADNMCPLYAQTGVKILVAALLTLMFQSIKAEVANPGKSMSCE